MKRQSVYTVAQVNSYIKNMFKQDYMLRNVCVKGEVSNCKYHSSGHIYFTLKDKLGVIACVMFAGDRAGLSFPLKEGMQIIVAGTIDVYERDGKYQLYAKEIEREGIGQLYERFEQLKQELEERGMFAPEYKQPIPKYSKTIGVVTAPTGAAIRDIITVSKRRNPGVSIIIYPAIVQGEQAAASIVNGIHALEKINVDVIIVGRGGGSLEDLWAFNEEIVAQAIFDCRIPIISAVGHETDFTIADFVADLRAATPSAAAELATWDVNAIANTIDQQKIRLQQGMLHILHQKRNALERKAFSLKRFSPESKIKDLRFLTMRQEEALKNKMNQILEKEKRLLAIYAERFKGLSPLDKLSQGFSFAENEKGENIHDISQVKKDDKLTLIVKNGKIHTIVTNTEAVQ